MQSCFKFSNVQTILLQSVRNAILLQMLLQVLKCYKCNTPMLSGIAPWPPSVSCDLHKAKRMSSSGQGRLDQADLSECQLEDCNGTGVFCLPSEEKQFEIKEGLSICWEQRAEHDLGNVFCGQPYMKGTLFSNSTNIKRRCYEFKTTFSAIPLKNTNL